MEFFIFSIFKLLKVSVPVLFPGAGLIGFPVCLKHRSYGRCVRRHGQDISCGRSESCLCDHFLVIKKKLRQHAADKENMQENACLSVNLCILFLLMTYSRG